VSAAVHMCRSPSQKRHAMLALTQIGIQWITKKSMVKIKKCVVLVSIIRGDHKVINGFDFLNSLFADIEIGNVSKNVAFILKTLIVFDFLVEAKLFLDIIKKY
jgi:hypothetical protein